MSLRTALEICCDVLGGFLLDQDWNNGMIMALGY